MKDREPITFKQEDVKFMIYEDLNGKTYIDRDYRVKPVEKFVNPLLDIEIFKNYKNEK